MPSKTPKKRILIIDDEVSFTWLLKPTAQLDVSGGVGISDTAPDWFVGAGVSLRYPR